MDFGIANISYLINALTKLKPFEPVFQAIFKHLPRQRRLDDASLDTSKQMLAMKPNKKLVQQHLQDSTGKVVLLKDLHNIAATITSAPVGGSLLQTLINDMRKEPGSITEIVTSAQNELRAIRAALCRRCSVSSQSCCCWMPLINSTIYVLMVEDGNGESQVVALWLVANEERDTITALMDLFVRHNDCAAIQCVMQTRICWRGMS